jgi:hypothetical protein
VQGMIIRAVFHTSWPPTSARLERPAPKGSFVFRTFRARIEAAESSRPGSVRVILGLETAFDGNAKGGVSEIRPISGRPALPLRARGRPFSPHVRFAARQLQSSTDGFFSLRQTDSASQNQGPRTRRRPRRSDQGFVRPPRIPFPRIRDKN